GDHNNREVEELHSVIRVQRDILESSNVGLMLVDREANWWGDQTRHNRAASLDWNIYKKQKYFIGQFVYSGNKEEGQPALNGGAAYVQGGHYGSLFWFDAHAYYYEPEFDINKTGFFQNIVGKGQKQLGLYADIHPFLNKRYIRSWGFSLQPTLIRDSDESVNSFGVKTTLWAETPDQSEVSVGFTRYRDVESDLYYLYFGRSRQPDLAYWGRDYFMQITSDPGKIISGRLNFNWDTHYYYQLHKTGISRGIDGALRLNPLSNAFLEFNYKRQLFLNNNGNELRPENIGQPDFQIYAMRWRYLFSKNIFTRGFFQFTNGAEEFVSVQQNGVNILQYDVWDRLSANLLLGWRFRPGSTLYLAYTQTWDQRFSTDFQSSNRILFFKFSYLWSL
ncbi:MAG: hypothetical protein WAN36_03220, partial [Calditrichia bacterium]